MDEVTITDLPAPTPENYQGQLSSEQHRWVTDALKRQRWNRLTLVVSFMFLFGVNVWQEVHAWPSRTTAQDIPYAILGASLPVTILCYFLWVTWKEYSSKNRVRGRLRNVLRETVEHGEGEVVWREYAYMPVIGGRGLATVDEAMRNMLPGRYRFFYLSRSGLLVAAEPIGELIPWRDLLITLTHTQGFSAATLAANRTGDEGPVRGRTTREDARGLVIFLGCLMVELVLSVIALISMQSAYPPSPYPFPPYPDYGAAPAAPSSSATVALMLALVTLVIAIPLLIALPALAGRRFPRLNLSMLLKKQHVLAAEGIASKSVRDADYLPIYTMEVGGRQFAIQKATYFALDTSLRYRVYYLPRGNRLLSMEPLASETAALAV